MQRAVSMVAGRGLRGQALPLVLGRLLSGAQVGQRVLGHGANLGGWGKVGAGVLVALSPAARRTCSVGHRSMTSTWPMVGRW